MASQGFSLGGFGCGLPLSARFGSSGLISCLGLLSPGFKVTVIFVSHFSMVFFKF